MPMRAHSVISLKAEGHAHELSKSATSIHENLQNVDFGHFIRTSCKVFGCPLIVHVDRMIVQSSPNKGAKLKRSPTYKRRKSMLPSTNHPTIESTIEPTIQRLEMFSPDLSLDLKREPERNKLHITAVYDDLYELVEIVMSKFHYGPIPRVLMQVIALKVPFIAHLTKFTIKQCCIDMFTLYELNKILAVSTITDICLDHSPLKEANYDILLSDASSLQSLSLARCNINDSVCERIASRLHYLEPAEQTLLVLNLSSNHITDVGLKHFGVALRSNRNLRYLNVSDNQIGDDGAKYIFEALTEFPLNEDEIEEKNSSYMQYLKDKEVLYRKYMFNLVLSAKKFNRRSTSVRAKGKSKSTVNRYPYADENLRRRARTMALQAAGPFEHPFSPSMVTVKKGRSHSIGNLTLCYLNLRYNNLTYQSVRRLATVVHQQKMYKNEEQCGLVNVLLEGNYVPKSVEEYATISKDGVDIESKQNKVGIKMKHAGKNVARRNK